MNDYEIDEIRRIRDQMAVQYGYDVKKLANHYRQLEQVLRKSGKYQFADEKRNYAQREPAQKTATDGNR